MLALFGLLFFDTPLIEEAVHNWYLPFYLFGGLLLLGPLNINLVGFGVYFPVYKKGLQWKRQFDEPTPVKNSPYQFAMYLRVSNEFGGTDFGPHTELEIKLGAHLEKCNIYIPERFSILDIHAKIIRVGEKTIQLSRANDAANIFLWSKEEETAKRLTVPTVLVQQDEFSLGTPEGPRFTVDFRLPPPPRIPTRPTALLKDQ